MRTWKFPQFRECFPYFHVEISGFPGTFPKFPHFPECFHVEVSRFPGDFPFSTWKSPHFQDFFSSFPHPSLSHPNLILFYFYFSPPQPLLSFPKFHSRNFIPEIISFQKFFIPQHPSTTLGNFWGWKNLGKKTQKTLKSRPQVSSWREFLPGNRLQVDPLGILGIAQLGVIPWASKGGGIAAPPQIPAADFGASPPPPLPPPRPAATAASSAPPGGIQWIPRSLRRSRGSWQVQTPPPPPPCPGGNKSRGGGAGGGWGFSWGASLAPRIFGGGCGISLTPKIWGLWGPLVPDPKNLGAVGCPCPPKIWGLWDLPVPQKILGGGLRGLPEP